jgi:hypothetical protein
MTRRDFGRSAALGAVSLAVTAGPAVRNVLGANDRVGIGLIGCGGMGQYNLKDFMRTNQVDVVAIAAGGYHSLALQADGKVLVGGAFTNLAGQTCFYLGRLNADGTLDGAFNPIKGITALSSPGVRALAVQADGKILVGGTFSAGIIEAITGSMRIPFWGSSLFSSSGWPSCCFF